MLQAFKASSQRPATAANAVLEGIVGDPGLLRPASHAHRAAFIFKHDAASTSAGLLARRCPDTVFWRVGPVVIYAVDCVPGRGGAHVGVEVLELDPSTANVDPSSAIPFPLRMVWISASVEHVRPAFMRTGSGHPMGTVGKACGSRRAFQSEASATRLVPASKIPGSREGFFPAVAKASPRLRTIDPDRVKRQHEKTSEALSYQSRIHVAGILPCPLT